MTHEQFITSLSAANVAVDDIQWGIKLLFKAVYSGRDEDITNAAERLNDAAAMLLAATNEIIDR